LKFYSKKRIWLGEIFLGRLRLGKQTIFLFWPQLYYVLIILHFVFYFYKFVNISKSFIFTLLKLWFTINLTITVYITLVPIFLTVTCTLSDIGLFFLIKAWTFVNFNSFLVCSLRDMPICFFCFYDFITLTASIYSPEFSWSDTVLIL
jgi:hypothetical protein